MSLITELTVGPIAIFGGCVAIINGFTALDTEERKREQRAANALDLSLSAAASTPQTLSKLKGSFDGLAGSGGKVSSAEWSQTALKDPVMQKAFGAEVTQVDLALQFQRLDADGSNELTVEKFEKGVQGFAESFGPALRIADSMATPEGVSELRKLFDALDKDDNGKVSSKEWSAAIIKDPSCASAAALERPRKHDRP